MTHKKVLIVDDIASSREAMIRLFEKIDWEVIGAAQNGLEALELIEKNRPDLVCLDIIMPVMDGIETYFHIQSFPSGPIPVLLVSCLTKEHAALESLTARVNVQLFCKKFPSAEELQEKVEIVLQLKHPAIDPNAAVADESTEQWLEKLGNQLQQNDLKQTA